MTGVHRPEKFEVNGRTVLVFDSASYVAGWVAESGANDPGPGPILVTASYAGVLCARMALPAKPSASIGLDCGVGKDGAGIAGLWYFDALEVPAAAIDGSTAEMGNGVDLWQNGVVSRVNGFAERLGAKPGMTTQECVKALTGNRYSEAVADPAHREVMHTSTSGRSIVCTDSIAFALPEDYERNVLCVAGHAGRSVLDYFRQYRPWAFIGNDGGVGKNDSGITAMYDVDADGLAGAVVSAQSARLGDGHSTYFDGVISACNRTAEAKGVRVGQTAREAAFLLLE
ncbi:hypothetical protein [Caballeronia sp. J97]|uniref:hypothetical protein n=1 Tax=Caballeronia sp. J97 TaxID=2805429 RepID=UPI002AB0A524|nr:hypothetical protein [Caballeronia sp. J97]